MTRAHGRHREWSGVVGPHGRLGRSPSRGSHLRMAKKTIDSTAWWEAEIPRITVAVREQARHQLRSRPGDVDEVVGRTLERLVIRMRAAPLPIEPDGPAHLTAIARWTARHVAMDLSRQSVRAAVKQWDVDELPSGEAAPDAQAAYREALRVVLRLLAEASPEDRALIEEDLGIGDGLPSQGPRDNAERQRAWRVRERFLKALTKELGTDGLALIGRTRGRDG